MEKLTAHYPLERIKAYVLAHGIRTFTSAARDGVKRLGLSPGEAVGMALGLTRSMLYKSMTTNADHRIWQDVYHAPCSNGKTAYIKLTLREDVVVIQFKEK